VTTQASAAEARRLVVAVVLAAIDQRDEDLHELLADADREMMTVAVGGLAIAVGAVLGEVSPERRAEIREYLAGCALGMAAWPEG
jgi:hypothetical protein